MIAPINPNKLARPVSFHLRFARNGMYALLLGFTLLVLAVTPLVGGTKIVHHWVITDQPMPKLKKILVIAVLENYLI